MASIGVQRPGPEERGKQPRPSGRRAHTHALGICKKRLKATVHIAFLHKPPCVRQAVQTPAPRGTGPVVPPFDASCRAHKDRLRSIPAGHPLPTTVGTSPPRRSRPVPVPQRCPVSSLPESPTNSRFHTGRRTLLKASVAAAVVAPVLAACSGESGSGGSGDGEPRQGGPLTVGVPGGVANVTQDAHDATDNVDSARTSALYASAMRLATDATIEPCLAESLESNDDGTAWTLVLKEGLTFHDDSPVTAASVVFSLKRI